MSWDILGYGRPSLHPGPTAMLGQIGILGQMGQVEQSSALPSDIICKRARPPYG
jgi:hypothetical protein